MMVPETMEAMECVMRILCSAGYGCTTTKIAPSKKSIIPVRDLELEMKLRDPIILSRYDQ